MAEKKQLAYIFDMDGVLIDSMPVYYRSYHDVFQKLYGVELTREVHLTFAGNKNEEVVAGIAKYFGITDIDVPKVNDMANEYCLSILHTAEVLHENAFIARTMLDNGIPVACASGGNAMIVRPSLELCGLGDITACITSEDVVHGKPDPEILLKAAAAMGVDPACCVMVGDALADIKAAKAAGMKALHFFRQGFYTC